MKLTAEQLEELQELGELQFSMRECSIIMEVGIDDLKLEKNAYDRGRLKASAEVRRAILKQAKQGSSPAQKQMLELIQKRTSINPIKTTTK